MMLWRCMTSFQYPRAASGRTTPRSRTRPPPTHPLNRRVADGYLSFLRFEAGDLGAACPRRGAAPGGARRPAARASSPKRTMTCPRRRDAGAARAVDARRRAASPAGVQEEAHRAYFISAADARQEPGEEPGEGARARSRRRGAAGQKEEADRADAAVGGALVVEGWGNYQVTMQLDEVRDVATGSGPG